jgi:hypothetical protein
MTTEWMNIGYLGPDCDESAHQLKQAWLNKYNSTACPFKNGPNTKNSVESSSHFCELGKAHLNHDPESHLANTTHGWYNYGEGGWIYWFAKTPQSTSKKPSINYITENDNGSWMVNHNSYNKQYATNMAILKKYATEQKSHCIVANGPTPWAMDIPNNYACELPFDHILPGEWAKENQGLMPEACGQKWNGSWAKPYHAYSYDDKYIFWYYNVSMEVKKPQYSKLKSYGGFTVAEDEGPYISSRCKRGMHKPVCDNPRCTCDCHAKARKTDVFARNVKPGDIIEITDLRGNKTKYEALGVSVEGELVKLYAARPKERYGGLLCELRADDRVHIARMRKPSFSAPQPSADDFQKADLIDSKIGYSYFQIADLIDSKIGYSKKIAQEVKPSAKWMVWYEYKANDQNQGYKFVCENGCGGVAHFKKVKQAGLSPIYLPNWACTPCARKNEQKYGNVHFTYLSEGVKPE